MPPNVILLAIGGMSVVVAIEVEWVLAHLLPETYRRFFASAPVRTLFSLAYFVGLPYLLLVSGLLPPRFWGLSGWDTLAQIIAVDSPAESLPHALNIIGTVVFGWLPDIGTVISTTLLPGVFLLILLIAVLRQGVLETDIWHNIRSSHIILDIIHWGFYRAMLWVVFGNLYLATVGGMIVVAFEWALANKIGAATAESQKQMALRYGLGAIAATSFIFVQNLWLIAFGVWVIARAIRSLVFVWQPRRIMAR